MTTSQWHRLYTASVAAPPQVLFNLLSDLPQYPDWLPTSRAYGATAEVDPYPVRLGSRYHDGEPDQPGNDWWAVTGFQPPGSWPPSDDLAAAKALTDGLPFLAKRDGSCTVEIYELQST